MTTLTTWNPSDASAGSVISGGGLTLGATGGGILGARATNPLNSGKGYFEITIDHDQSGNGTCGIATAAANLSGGVGASSGEVAAHWSGNIWAPSLTGISLGFIATGAVLCAAFDLTNQLVWFRVGSGSWNADGTANPATGAGGISYSSIGTSTVYPLGSTDSGLDGLTANFGASTFSQSVPSGFSSWDALAAAGGGAVRASPAAVLVGL